MRIARLVASLVPVAFLASLYACGSVAAPDLPPAPPDTTDDMGTGGDATGGTSATGGSTSTGGTTSSGGSTPSAGTTGSAGTSGGGTSSGGHAGSTGGGGTSSGGHAGTTSTGGKSGSTTSSPIPDACWQTGPNGCCADDGNNYFCSSTGVFKQKQCSGGCGWNASKGYYDCGFSGTDPGGSPITCGGSSAIPTTCTGARGKAGCCGSDGNDYYCASGTLKSSICGSMGCGWNDTKGYYDCGFSGADPTGTHPIDCLAQ